MLKKVGYSAFWFKIAQKFPKKVLVFQKVARSCSLTKRLLKILKVAKKLPSRIWKGLDYGIGVRCKISIINRFHFDTFEGGAISERGRGLLSDVFSVHR